MLIKPDISCATDTNFTTRCTASASMVASPEASQRSVARVNATSPKGQKLSAELLRVNAQIPEPSVLRYAADLLTRGRVIAVPTDTVYGLAADPFNLAAVAPIFLVTGRPDARPLPLLVTSIDQAMAASRE